MHKAILAVALSLIAKNNAICAVSLVTDFCRKRVLGHVKNTLNSCHGNQNVSCDQALDKLSEKPNSRSLVPEEHGFQKGASCAPPLTATGAKQKKKPGVDRVKAKTS